MVTVPARRNIVTTPVRRSGADPLIGHVEQEAMPGAVSDRLILIFFLIYSLIIFFQTRTYHFRFKTVINWQQ